MRKPAWSADARSGPVRKFHNLHVFACEGLVCIIDNRQDKEGEFKALAPSEAHKRLRGLVRTYRNQTPAQMPAQQRKEYKTTVQGCANVDECIKEARAMGDPTDPRVQAFWRRHSRNSSVSMALAAARARPQILPPIKGVSPQRMAQIAKSPVHKISADTYQPPKRKNLEDVV